ncbi:MAG: putative maltokinase [Rudaea sp.]
MRRLLAVRKGFAAFGRGSLAFLRPANRKILAYLREYGDETILCVANLARSAQPVELDLGRYKGRIPIELMGRTAFPPIGELPYLLTLSAHAFLWFRLAAPDQHPAGREEQVPRDELPVLVLFDGFASLFRDRVVPWRIAMSERVRNQLEREALPAFVAGRRWYAAKGERVRRVEIADHVEWTPHDRSWLVTIVHVDAGGSESQVYFLPLALAWEEHDEPLLRALGSFTVAKARQQAQVGVLADAFGDEGFVRALVAAVGAGETVKADRGTLHFRATTAFRDIVGDALATLPLSIPGAHSSNTVVALGERVFVKGYRRLQPGLNPEAEIGRYLTDVAKFPHVVPVAGSIDYVADNGRVATLALVQGYVQNQGNGWDYTQNYLERFFDDVSRDATAASGPDVHGAYVALARTLGRRTAQLHAALARAGGDPAFDPVPIAQDAAAWSARVRREAGDALDRLARRVDALPEAARADAARLLAARDALLARIDAHAQDASAGAKTRVHGDYHLGQVLLVQNDFVITDFEGEPSRTMEERAEKQSPLKDVAGMLRSFDYAMHAALLRFGTERPDAIEAVAPAGRDWHAHAAAAFLDGYDDVAHIEGLAGARAEMRGLLELFVLEKAVYELRYEADNRPNWVRIPLAGLLDIVARHD